MLSNRLCKLSVLGSSAKLSGRNRSGMVAPGRIRGNYQLKANLATQLKSTRDVNKEGDYIPTLGKQKDRSRSCSEMQPAMRSSLKET